MCGPCVATVRVREGCSPFAAVAGAAVSIYAAASGGPALATATTDALGEAALAIPEPGTYWVAASKAGCAAGARKPVALACGGEAEASIWCATGRHGVDVNLCCSASDHFDPIPYTVTKGGVLVASGATDPGLSPFEQFRFPKSEGAGLYDITVGPSRGCGARTVSYNATAAQLCSNTTSGVTLAAPDFPSRCCGLGLPLPLDLKLVDGFGVHARNGTSQWGFTSTGVRDSAQRPRVRNVLALYRVIDLSGGHPACGLPTNCDRIHWAWGQAGFAPNAATALVGYSLACGAGEAPGTIRLTLTASWWYRKDAASEGFGGGTAGCNRCVLSSPVVGVCQGDDCDAAYPDCTSRAPAGNVTVSLTESGCVRDGAPAGWRQWRQSYEAGPTGAQNATATATWEGVVADPSSFSATFELTGPAWTVDGPIVPDGDPFPDIPPPPPPAGTSITVMYP